MKCRKRVCTDSRRSYPTAAVRLVALPQGQGHVAKFTPAARIEEV